MKKTKVVKLSICKCGFPLFNDSVKIGDEYDAEPFPIMNSTLTCGGCKAIVNTKAVIISGHGDRGWLPSEAFDLFMNKPKTKEEVLKAIGVLNFCIVENEETGKLEKASAIMCMQAMAWVIGEESGLTDFMNHGNEGCPLTGEDLDKMIKRGLKQAAERPPEDYDPKQGKNRTEGDSFSA